MPHMSCRPPRASAEGEEVKKGASDLSMTSPSTSTSYSAFSHSPHSTLSPAKENNTNMDLTFDDYVNEPYDCIANEPRPDSVIYTQMFRDLRAANVKAAVLLREPLQNSEFQNILTRGLLTRVDKRTKENCPDELIIAIAGDMKAGECLGHTS